MRNSFDLNLLIFLFTKYPAGNNILFIAILVFYVVPVFFKICCVLYQFVSSVILQRKIKMYFLVKIAV